MNKQACLLAEGRNTYSLACEVLELRRKRDELTADRDYLREELKQAGKNCAALTNDLYRVRQERDELEADRDNWRFTYNALEAKHDELRSEWNTIEGIR